MPGNMPGDIERRALYPGSFDPPTNGHLYVAEKVSQDYDFGIVAIGVNPEKRGRFPVTERMDMLREMFEAEGLENLDVASFGGLLQIDYAEMVGARYIIRGMRNSTDFEYESTIQHFNSSVDQANPRIETRAIVTPEEYLLISSSMVMGLVGNEGWEPVVSQMVHPKVFEHLAEYQRQKDHSVYGQRWNNLWQQLGARDSGQEVFEDIFARYAEPNRHYHGFNHLKTCLNELDMIRDNADDPDALELALWFHDVIYKSNIQKYFIAKFDDEGASADYAVDIIVNKMGLTKDLADKVASYITAIKRKDGPLTKDEKYMIDIDTAIFGRSTRLYGIYESQILKEYDWVSPEVYNPTRARVLESFLPSLPTRPYIYRTSDFIDRYEKQAQLNLVNARKALLG